MFQIHLGVVNSQIPIVSINAKKLAFELFGFFNIHRSEIIVVIQDNG